MDKQDPPKVLVETWLHLLTQNEDTELKEHGKICCSVPLRICKQ
jgi:hypothetical protein